MVGLVLSIVLLGFGLPLYRRKYELKGWLGLLMLLLGILGVVASLGWLALVAYADAHVR